MLVDITNDGQRSGQNATMTINPQTGQVDGGASFSGSFGTGQSPLLSLPYHANVVDTSVGRYNAFTCVTFKGEGFTLGAPTEYGVWSANTPVRNVTTVPPVPGKDTCIISDLAK
jgi:hypothetical protein